MTLIEEIAILKKLSESVADNLELGNTPKACIKLGMLMCKIHLLHISLEEDEGDEEDIENEKDEGEDDKIRVRRGEVKEFFKILKGLGNG